MNKQKTRTPVVWKELKMLVLVRRKEKRLRERLEVESYKSGPHYVSLEHRHFNEIKIMK